jgi:hypothetical protein
MNGNAIPHMSQRGIAATKSIKQINREGHKGCEEKTQNSNDQKYRAKREYPFGI